MIYITNKDLPKEFQNDNGLNLCKMWFYALKNDIDKNSFKKFNPDCIKLKEISQYKLTENEILLINNTYCVGDGFGNIRYSPCRENEDIRNYKLGKERITKKFEVEYE